MKYFVTLLTILSLSFSLPVYAKNTKEKENKDILIVVGISLSALILASLSSGGSSKPTSP